MPGLSALATRPSRRRCCMEVTALKGSSGDRAALRRSYFRRAWRPLWPRGNDPTSAKTKRRSTAYLTIETPVVACPFRVHSHPLGGDWPIPVYLHQRTSPDRRGWSVWCQQPTLALGPAVKRGWQFRLIGFTRGCGLARLWCKSDQDGSGAGRIAVFKPAVVPGRRRTGSALWCPAECRARRCPIARAEGSQKSGSSRSRNLRSGRSWGRQRGRC